MWVWDLDREGMGVCRCLRERGVEGKQRSFWGNKQVVEQMINATESLEIGSTKISR